MKQINIQRYAALAAAVAFLGSGRVSAFSQTPAPMPFDVSGLKPTLYGGQKLAYLDDKGTPKSATKPCLESLPGNGTRAGYMLSHGGIVPASVRVSVGARSLRSGVDYGLDYASGMLVFTEPVRRFQTVTVSYEYVVEADANRSSLTGNGLALNFRGTSLNFGYGVSSFNGLDFNSYGLSLTSKVGASGTLKGLVYFSTPSATNQNVLGRTDATRAAPVKRDASAARSDHLVTQELNARFGAATVRATYQDVGMAFGGFQAMRQAHAGNQEVLNQLGVLEKERGIRRLGFGTSLAVSKDGKLGFDWDRTSDGKGSISRQQLSLSTKSLSFTYSDLEIGRSFEGFQRLREGQAPQWARERGLRRTNMGLSLTPGKGSSLAFEQGALQDVTGTLMRQSFSLSGSGMSFSYTRRSVDSSFGRLNDLSDAEKGELALEIRRQFNPNAQAGEITPQERQQIAGEAGIDRSRLAFQSRLGKDGTLAFTQFNVSDAQGGIRRQSVSLNLKGVPVFTYMNQSIDRSFGHFGSLNVFERSQYGNELGMRRTALSALLPLGKASALAYTQWSAGDQAGSMNRQTIAYTGKGVNAVLNIASTDSSFARARDLAGVPDPEKAAIEAERGFRRTDFAANVTAMKGLRFDTYTYNAANAAESIALNRFRHFADWTPSRSSRITYLTEGQSRSQNGALQLGNQHTLLTFDHQFGRGMKLNMFDEKVTTLNGDQRTVVSTRFAHFETDRSKANNLMAEMKRIQMTGGAFENTTHLDLNLRPARNLGLHLNHLSVDRGTNPSATTNTLALNWQINPKLQFAGAYAHTTTNNGSDAVTRMLSLKGEPFRGVSLTASLAETAVEGKPMRSASELVVGHAKPFSLLGMTNVTMGLKYSNLND